MVLADGWYAEALGLRTLEDERLPRWLPISNPVFRGLVLWWRGHRYQSLVLVGTGLTFKVVMFLERLRPRRRRYLVLLQFIPIPERAWATLGRRSRIDYWLRLVFQRRVIAPVLRRSLVCAHTLSSWEVPRNAGMFNVDPSRFRFVPSTRVLTDNEIPPYYDRGRRVLASGRSLCDWPTVFAAAEGQDWDLEIVCTSDDLPLIQRLNRNGVAKVRHDIPLQGHRGMLKEFAVYLLALEEAEISCGQIRVMDAVSGGTPVVASRVRGLTDYLVDEETSLCLSRVTRFARETRSTRYSLTRAEPTVCGPPRSIAPEAGRRRTTSVPSGVSSEKPDPNPRLGYSEGEVAEFEGQVANNDMGARW